MLKVQNGCLGFLSLISVVKLRRSVHADFLIGFVINIESFFSLHAILNAAKRFVVNVSEQRGMVEI